MQTRASSNQRIADARRAPVFPVGHILPFALVTVLFFIWGMSNNLTDILVQQFKKSFELSPLQAQLVKTAVFFGYACVPIPAALFMRRWGYKAGVIAGLCVFSAGTLFFWPAAAIGQYTPFLIALYFVGCGSAMLETASHPFIAQCGAAETSEQRLNFALCFNAPGSITGIIIGAYCILSGIEKSPAAVEQMKAAGTYAAYRHMELLRVVPTYIVIGALILLYALMIGFIKFPSIQSEHEGSADHGRFIELFAHPNLWAAILAEFCYCGAQFATWSAFIFYMKQYTGVEERTAALFLTGNLVAMTLGRFVSTWLMQWLDPARMTALYAVIDIVLLAYSILRPGFAGAMAILASSFFMSIMFPTIFAMGIKGLGANTKLGGSLLVMSVAGGGVFPPLLGFVAKSTGSYALGYAVLLAAYAVVAIYGFYGRGMQMADDRLQSSH